MVRILERYKNEATGAIAFKRLLVKEIDGMFRVVKEFDYGNGAGGEYRYCAWHQGI